MIQEITIVADWGSKNKQFSKEDCDKKIAKAEKNLRKHGLYIHSYSWIANPSGVYDWSIRSTCDSGKITPEDMLTAEYILKNIFRELTFEW